MTTKELNDLFEHAAESGESAAMKTPCRPSDGDVIDMRECVTVYNAASGVLMIYPPDYAFGFKAYLLEQERAAPSESR